MKREAIQRIRQARAIGTRLRRLACLAWLLGIRIAAAEPVPTFHESVAPILQAHCAECHRPGQSGPFPLLTYADAVKHSREMVDVTARGVMPPWLPAPQAEGFLGERRLSAETITVLARWVSGGMPEGDSAKGPPPRTWPADWTDGPPDLVVRMPVPYFVPASGRDVYRHFVLPMSLDRPRQVRQWELRPKSRAAHHAFVRVDATGEARRRDALDAEPGFHGMDTPAGIQTPDGHFSSWQPGAGPRRHRPGMSWTLRPGQDVVLQVHLQPLGKPEPLQMEIGFYFTDEAPIHRPVKLSLIQYGIDLAPGATNQTVRDEVRIPADADLLGVLPHAHYLGRRLEAWATFPDGTGRSLFLIPDWDFNWQGDYTYARPVFLPAGTRVEMRVTFDNSAANPRNPHHPPRRVRFGPDTTDEMAEVWLQLLPRSTSGQKAWDALNFERTLRDTLAFNAERLRIDPRDATAHVHRGRAFLAKQRMAEAEAEFIKALEISPRLDEAHYYVGISHRMKGENAAAIAAFRRALEANPDHVRAHGNLGLLEVEAGHEETAAVEFAAAVRLDPTDALATSMLGLIRYNQGRLSEARPLLEKAAGLNPGDTQVREALTRIRAATPSP